MYPSLASTWRILATLSLSNVLRVNDNMWKGINTNIYKSLRVESRLVGSPYHGHSQFMCSTWQDHGKGNQNQLLKCWMIPPAPGDVSRYRIAHFSAQNTLVGGLNLKNISQLGLSFPIYGKNVPNHQPALFWSEKWSAWKPPTVIIYPSPRLPGMVMPAAHTSQAWQ